MKTVLLVAVRECLTLLRRPSFYLTLLIGPLIVGGMLFGFSLINDEFADDVAPEQSLAKPSGYLDQSGVVAAIPESLQPYFMPYDDEASATAALRAGTIGSYFIVVQNYRATGEVVRVGEQATFTSDAAPDVRAFRAILRLNLATNPLIARRLDQPFDLDLKMTDATGGDTPSSPPSGAPFGLPMALGLLLALSIVNGGGWLVQAVAEEKESRTIEIILTSLRPLQLMAGKLLGLGTVALLQLLLWLGLSRGLMGNAVTGLGSFSVGSVPAQMWLWVVIFFLLGFLMFGGIMLSLGAVGATARETGQITGLLTLPVVAPLWFAAPIAENPDGMLALVLSLVPVTAPVSMTMRLAEGTVPLWQLLLSAGLLLLSLIGTVWLAARLFRGSTLLTGARPTPRALWRALRAN